MSSVDLATIRAPLLSPRLAGVMLLAATLAGCSAQGVETRPGYEAMAMTPDVSGAGMTRAMLPASAGEVISVTERVENGVVSQRIALRGDPGVVGENTIIVKVNNYPGAWDLDGPAGVINRNMIALELNTAFPGGGMEISQAYERNSFGPFGYAVGHPQAGVTCVYAWEFGVWKWSKLGEAPTGGPSMPMRPTSVRVRLCRSKLGEAEMVAMLRALQVFPAGSRIAYVDPNFTAAAGDGDALAAAGVGYSVAPSARLATVAREPEERPVRRKVAHHAHRRRHYADQDVEEGRAAADERPLPGAVAVPLPGGGAPGAAAMAPTAAANPLLAPLAALAPARVTPSDDLPLPSRTPVARPAPAAAAPRSATIPLPD